MLYYYQWRRILRVTEFYSYVVTFGVLAKGVIRDTGDPPDLTTVMVATTSAS